MKYKIDVDEFLKFEPESCYILGLMWADATLNSGDGYSIMTTGIKEDLESASVYFNKYGSWGYYYRNKWCDSIKRKEQLTIYISNKNLYKYLDSVGYKDKNIPLILKDIPEENRKYWWRGYTDGDGCFYFNLKQRHKDFFYTSYYDQDWSFVEKLFISLNIDYKIVNTKSKKSSCSRIIIKKDENVIKFGNFIYDGYESDCIGYNRKFEKFNSIKNWKSDKYFKSDGVSKVGGSWVGTFNYKGNRYYCGSFKNRLDAVDSVISKKKEVILTGS